MGSSCSARLAVGASGDIGSLAGSTSPQVRASSWF